MKDYEYMQMSLDIFGKPENVGGVQRIPHFT